ncbi:MAG: hypothetical protein D4R64_02425 [Porphyromonadaceae bacterium]|nr:MAG: hypothetical protein D4R64_02425 [Porphyromonadaceae bacterium]
MKTLYCKSALLLVLMLAAGISLGAQSLKKDFHKEFSTTSTSELLIDNQFGNITVTDWDQNKVVIDVNIEVTGSDQSKAQKLMDKINIDFKEEGSRIIAKTKLGEAGNLNLKFKGDKQSFRIDYTIKCPKNIQLNLDNQFGDVIISSLTGSFNADLQFGSLNAMSLTGPETKIDMQFGKVTIGTMKDAKIDIQHCELLKISECGNLTVDAQFTQIEIGSVGSLKADLNNSEVTVDVLTDMLKMDMNMGNVKIGNVSAEFKSIVVDQNMGDLTIGIDPKAGYTLTAEVNMGSIKVPEGLKLYKEKEPKLPGISAEKVSGTFGNGNSTITIDSNMGSVKIK